MAAPQTVAPKLQAEPGQTSATSRPLVFDLDGTLHHGDLTALGLRWLWRRKPTVAMRVLNLLSLNRRAAAKVLLETYMLRHGVQPKLRWDDRVLAAATEAAQAGREVWVATGSPQAWAAMVMAAHGHPWPVLGTTQERGNLTGPTKAAALVAKFGAQGFDYVGNSKDDLAVWPQCHEAWVANPNPKVGKLAVALPNLVRHFPRL